MPAGAARPSNSPRARGLLAQLARATLRRLVLAAAIAGVFGLLTDNGGVALAVLLGALAVPLSSNRGQTP